MTPLDSLTDEDKENKKKLLIVLGSELLTLILVAYVMIPGSEAAD